MQPQVFDLVSIIRSVFKLMKPMIKTVNSELFLTLALLFSSPHNWNQSNKLLLGVDIKCPFLVNS